MSKAEEYLAQAEWIVLKTQDVGSAIKSRLHRNLGLLHASKGDFSEALRHLAEDVSTLCSSIVYRRSCMA